MVEMIKSDHAFDTDTATCVYHCEGHGGDRYQGLYQRPNGEFLLWEYDASEGWGHKEPLTDEAAYKWLEQHAHHLLEQYFQEGGAAERPPLHQTND